LGTTADKFTIKVPLASVVPGATWIVGFGGTDVTWIVVDVVAGAPLESTTVAVTKYSPDSIGVKSAVAPLTASEK